MADGETLVMGYKPAEDSGIRWLNPFSGEMEVWHNGDMAVASQLRAAAKRINELEEEVRGAKYTAKEVDDLREAVTALQVVKLSMAPSGLNMLHVESMVRTYMQAGIKADEVNAQCRAVADSYDPLEN